MKKSQMICLLLTAVVTMIFVMKRFNVAFPDSQYYSMMLDDLLGRGTGAAVGTPFAFRPLVPVLAMPFGLFVASDVALSIVSVIASVGLAIVMFYICREFTEYDVVAMVIVLLVVSTNTFCNYGSSALTDPVAMLFLASIVLATLRDSDWRKVFLLIVVGVLAKELVLFGAVFYVLKKQSVPSVINILCGIEVCLIIRDVISGHWYQPFSVHEPQAWVGNTTLQILYWLACMSTLLIVAWVQHSDRVRDSIMMFITAVIAFGPYYLLGVFCAYFDPRFVWPLQLAFLGMMSVGLGSAYEAVLRRVREG